MVEIETRCRIPIWRTFGRIPWHFIPEPPATLQSAVTWRNQCHDRATLQGVIISSAKLKTVFRHILFFFVFFNAVWALTSGGFRIVSDTLVSLSVLQPVRDYLVLHTNQRSTNFLAIFSTPDCFLGGTRNFWNPPPPKKGATDKTLKVRW